MTMLNVLGEQAAAHHVRVSTARLTAALLLGLAGHGDGSEGDL